MAVPMLLAVAPVSLGFDALAFAFAFAFALGVALGPLAAVGVVFVVELPGSDFVAAGDAVPVALRPASGRSPEQLGATES
jgi:hypothetical protein